MAIDLTSEQRLVLWQKLTPLQQETLQQFKKYQIQSLFLTENFLKDEEWQFADFTEKPLDKGLYFPRRYYNHFTNRGLKSNCSSIFN